MDNVAGFTDTELMICAAARVLEDRKTVFVGWGIPQVVALLAEKLYAPDLVQVFEFGAIGPQSLTPFVRGTMGGPSNIYRSLQWTNMNWAFSYAATGYLDYGMIGALQVDAYGNVNSTLKTIVVLKHEPRRFVQRLDFMTSPGYLTGPRARERAGLPRGTGPYRVVTSQALFGFEEETKHMLLLGVLRGLAKDQVIRGMSFQPMVAEKVEIVEPPTQEELRVLREEIDPARMIIGRPA